MSVPPNPSFPYYPVGYTGGYSWDQVSPWITQYESGNRNILSGVPGSTASGYWQINNPTWSQYASQLGIDTSQYPTAMSAPQSVQSQVAQAIFNDRGLEPWATAPQVLASLDSGASAGASAVSQALTDAANTGNPNVTIPGVQQGQSVQSDWLSGIFDTISSLFGRGAIMILGGGLIIVGALAAIYGENKAPITRTISNLF